MVQPLPDNSFTQVQLAGGFVKIKMLLSIKSSVVVRMVYIFLEQIKEHFASRARHATISVDIGILTK